jgi:hypothetical protein
MTKICTFGISHSATFILLHDKDLYTWGFRKTVVQPTYYEKMTTIWTYSIGYRTTHIVLDDQNLYLEVQHHCSAIHSLRKNDQDLYRGISYNATHISWDDRTVPGTSAIVQAMTKIYSIPGALGTAQPAPQETTPICSIWSPVAACGGSAMLVYVKDIQLHCPKFTLSVTGWNKYKMLFGFTFSETNSV